MSELDVGNLKAFVVGLQCIKDASPEFLAFTDRLLAALKDRDRLRAEVLEACREISINEPHAALLRLGAALEGSDG